MIIATVLPFGYPLFKAFSQLGENGEFVNCIQLQCAPWCSFTVTITFRSLVYGIMLFSDWKLINLSMVDSKIIFTTFIQDWIPSVYRMDMFLL